jgi:Ferritin-like
MLMIDRDRLDSLLAARSAEDVYPHLQAAIELEHATIPLYLTAFFSIKKGFMLDTAAIVKSVFIEEMLHMTIACNVLNAINGAPAINKRDFVPTYPGPLPMNVVNGLQVHLAGLSLDQIRLFMHIEEPEVPLKFPIKSSLLEIAPSFATIGMFYQALIEKIQNLGDKIFTGDPTKQVVSEQWFADTELFAIRTADDAVKGLEIIVEQGEGTRANPLSGSGLAHYYRFAEILNGKTLVKDPTVPEGFSYSGAAIPFDSAGVWNIVTNSKASQYQDGSRARLLVDEFNDTYGKMLNSLHNTFNGSPESLDGAVGLMFQLVVLGGQVVATTDAVTGKQAAPSFEFL